MYVSYVLFCLAACATEVSLSVSINDSAANLTVEEGKTVVLKCEATGAEYQGLLPGYCFHNNSVFPFDFDNIPTTLGSCVYPWECQLEDVSYNDSGWYSCGVRDADVAQVSIYLFVVPPSSSKEKLLSHASTFTQRVHQ